MFFQLDQKQQKFCQNLEISAMFSKNLIFCKLFQKLELIRKVIVNGCVIAEIIYCSNLARELNEETVQVTW